ncbi:MAG: DotA/TraY family protein [Alphaproteobacteria bacterium]|nr:DotA/TraY family protein [Alphaproteobacteria bacterium]
MTAFFRAAHKNWLGSSVLFVITFFFSLFLGRAHAAAQGSSLFAVQNPANDWGLAWINYLFFGAPINVLNGAINTGVSGACGWQSGLSKALGFYSNGILVLAGVLLLYHLVSMVAETAHTGMPMGKRANQIWAPLRLVFAIGLLVPVGISSRGACDITGLNTGQYIVVQMAKWGSGLASNIWTTFTNNLYSQQTANTVTACPKETTSGATSPSCVHVSPMAQTFALGMISDLTCMYLYNHYVDILDGTGQFDIHYNPRTHLIGKAGGAKICGGYVPVDTSKLKTNTYASVYAAQQAVVDKYVNGIFNDYASTYVNYFYNDNCHAEVPSNDTVLRLVQQFQNDLDDATRDVVQAVDNAQAVQNDRNNAAYKEGGWLSAGVWINSISRLQAERSDSIQNGLPQLVAPTLPHEVQARDNPLNLTENVRPTVVNASIDDVETATLKNLNAFNQWLTPDNGSSSSALNAAATAGSAAPTGSSIGASVFNAILSLVDNIAGWTNVWDSSGALAIKFDRSRNPLAEVAAFGQNVVGTGSSLIGWGATIYAGSGLAKLLSFIPGIGSVLGAIGGAFAVAATLIIGIGVFLLGAGILLAYFLPLVPFTRFFFASLTWIIGVAEAVVAAPLLALAHINPEGDGLPGAQAKQGYFFIINIFLRPALMIFGLIIGILLFNVGISFLNGMFLLATQGTGMTQLPVLSKIIFTIMYCALAYVLGNSCFKSIGMFPEFALRWLGGSGHMEKMGDHTTVLKAVGMAGAYMGGKEVMVLSKAPGDALSGIGTHLQNRQNINMAEARHQQVLDTLSGEKKTDKKSTPDDGGNTGGGGNAKQMPPCNPSVHDKNGPSSSAKGQGESQQQRRNNRRLLCF